MPPTATTTLQTGDPALLRALEFRSNNQIHQPMIRALDVIKRTPDASILVLLHFLSYLTCPSLSSKKDRLTKSFIPGPLREFDLADHFRPHQMTPFYVGGT